MILESTTYPTTTRDVMVPILNRNLSGLVCSRDVFVAFSPEREDPGKPIKGSKICLLGVAYKKDVDDPRESPSFELMELLLERGAILTYSDPHVPHLPKMRHYHHLPAMSNTELTAEFLATQDCALISTDHTTFDYEHIVRHSLMVLDTRNATKNVAAGREKIFKA